MSGREKHYRVRNGKVYGRITFIDENGKRRDVMRLAESKTAAKDVAKRLRQEFDDHGTRVIDSDHMTFCQLADLYENDHLIPAKYRDGRKTEGLRSLKPAKNS